MFIHARKTGQAGRAVDRRRFIMTVGALAAAAVLPGSRKAQAQTLAPDQLAGTWSGEEASWVGVMSVEVIFFPNGTYRRSHWLGDLMTFDVGSYSIEQSWIHFELDEYGPHYYKGQPMTRPMSDTWVVDYFDGDALQATVGGSDRVSVRRQ
jgi:hypothetical protein